MREMTPTYHPGDPVELHGDWFEISSYQREGMPGYWLKGEQEKNVFLPVDMEDFLRRSGALTPQDG